jgi:RIO kinase 2
LIHINKNNTNSILSSVQIAANVVKNLEPEDYKLLRVFASGLEHHETLTRHRLVGYSKLHGDIVDYRLKGLQERNLINKNNRGFTILNAGLDTFALKILAEKNIISGIGKPIGVGKESDVYEAVTDRQEDRAVKFFRIGRISFRETTKKRSFALKEHDNIHHWLLVNISAAKKEVDMLQRLKNTGISLPLPLYRAMHCIAMNRINGARLVSVKDLEQPSTVLQNILLSIGIAYKNHIIHSDLSEYNVLVGEASGDTWIIDWPQAVATDHPNAQYLIKRDVFNIVRFFNRRFAVGKNLDDALRDVLNSSTSRTSTTKNSAALRLST